MRLESKAAIAMSAEQKATQADALAFRRSGDPGELLLCLRMEQSAEQLGLLACGSFSMLKHTCDAQNPRSLSLVI